MEEIIPERLLGHDLILKGWPKDDAVQTRFDTNMSVEVSDLAFLPILMQDFNVLGLVVKVSDKLDGRHERVGQVFLEMRLPKPDLKATKLAKKRNKYDISSDEDEDLVQDRRAARRELMGGYGRRWVVLV